MVTTFSPEEEEEYSRDSSARRSNPATSGVPNYYAPLFVPQGPSTPHSQYQAWVPSPQSFSPRPRSGAPLPLGTSYPQTDPYSMRSPYAYPPQGDPRFYGKDPVVAQQLMADMSIGMRSQQDMRTPPSGPASGNSSYPGPYPGAYQPQAYQPAYPPHHVVQSYPNQYAQMMPPAHPSPPRQPFVQPGARRPADTMQFYPSQQSQWDSPERKVAYRPPQTSFRAENGPRMVPSLNFVSILVISPPFFDCSCSNNRWIRAGTTSKPHPRTRRHSRKSRRGGES